VGQPVGLTVAICGPGHRPPLIRSNREAAARIAGCEFAFVPGVDHFPPLRAPGLVLDLISRTLAGAGW
jgi:3-oxoadipate enol-lactonase